MPTIRELLDVEATRSLLSLEEEMLAGGPSAQAPMSDEDSEARANAVEIVVRSFPRGRRLWIEACQHLNGAQRAEAEPSRQKAVVALVRDRYSNYPDLLGLLGERPSRSALRILRERVHTRIAGKLRWKESAFGGR